jgi:hypothetical protein
LTLGTTSSWKTLLQVLAPSNQRVFINSWGVYSKGTVNTDKPIRIRLIRQSTAGTPGSTLTPGKKNTAFTETVQTAGYSGTFSAEPTVSGEPLDEKMVHPQAGVENVSFERGEIQLAGGERAAIQYLNDAGAAVDVVADMSIEE